MYIGIIIHCCRSHSGKKFQESTTSIDQVRSLTFKLLAQKCALKVTGRLFLWPIVFVFVWIEQVPGGFGSSAVVLLRELYRRGRPWRARGASHFRQLARTERLYYNILLRATRLQFQVTLWFIGLAFAPAYLLV